MKPFNELDGYGGCEFGLLPDGRLRTSTCCDSDTYDRATIERLRDWLTQALKESQPK